jgi:protein involved in polysaccharide export with SLBB domain
MRFPRRPDSALALLLALAGCDDMSALVSREPAPYVAPARALRLQIGDKVKVVVIGDDKLNGEYQVDGRGAISVPAAGAVNAVGRSAENLGAALQQRLRERQYLLNPIVNVTISEFRPFYVLGEVEKPGEYPYHTGLNVLSAIAVAGGDTYRASRSSALVQRAGETTFHEVPLSPKVPIYPGDLVKLPERYF